MPKNITPIVAEIRIFDPQGKRAGKHLIKNVNWVDSSQEAVCESDLVIILTEWNEFRALDLKKMSSLMRSAYMADLRNIYTEKEVLECGFKKYISVF